MLVAMIAISLIITGAALISWIHEVPIDPPTAVIMRRFGEIVWAKVIRGWLIVIPHIESFESFHMQKFLLRMTPQKVFTQDNIGLEMSVTLHLEPDPDNLLAYLQSGKEEEIKEILAEIAEQEIRQWAKGSPDSPKTWEEAQGCQNDLVEKLHQRLTLRCNGNPNDPRHALKDYGVFLDKVTIGSIILKAEMVDFNVQLKIAKVVSETLGISIEAALEKTREYEILKAAKSGGLYKISFQELTPLLEYFKQTGMAKGGKS